MVKYINYERINWAHVCTTKKVELVRKRFQDRGRERLFFSIGVDTIKTKGERKTKGNFELEGLSRKRNKGWLKTQNIAKAAARNRQC